MYFKNYIIKHERMVKMQHTNKNIPNNIIVISGGSFQGKSLTAFHIAKKFKIPLVICTDTIRNVLHTLNPLFPYFFTSTYLMSSNNLKRQKMEVSKILQGLLMLYDKRGENVIIEGMHFSKEFLDYISEKSNALCFCIDNKLSFNKRLEYKSITRYKVEYLDPKTGKINYGQLTKDNLSFTPYIKYADRIEKIHQEIVNYFFKNNLSVIEFYDLAKALEVAEKLIEKFVLNKKEYQADGFSNNK